MSIQTKNKLLRLQCQTNTKTNNDNLDNKIVSFFGIDKDLFQELYNEIGSNDLFYKTLIAYYVRNGLTKTQLQETIKDDSINNIAILLNRLNKNYLKRN
jgi:hypothetical protein